MIGIFADGSIAGAWRPDTLMVYLGGIETLRPTVGDSAKLLANALAREFLSSPKR
ncbi:MAG: hypothetical protein NTZ56_13450 [Acidobacteria bacterium]|nr:hypothetical protein [Acidobacteriota bacterium]